MFGLFKKKSEKEKLMEEYKRLKEEAFVLSKTNRSQSDAKNEEAELLYKKIESLSE